MKPIDNIEELVTLRDSFKLTDIRWQETDARIRKLLINKYKYKMSLCIRSDLLPPYIKEGFISSQEINYENKNKITEDLSRIADYVPKSYCEHNPLYRQIIPCSIVFNSKDDILIFKKTTLTMGIGGYISSDQNASLNIVLEEAKRAVSKVIDCETETSFEGIMYDPVLNKDNLYFIFFSYPRKKIEGLSMNKKQIENSIDKFDEWSKSAINYLNISGASAP